MMNGQPQANETEWTLGRLLSWTSDYLSRRDVDDARLSAEVLLAGAAECRRIDLYARFDTVLDAVLLGKFREWVERAGSREPIAYIVGEKEFFSLAFQVTRDVLIPRPETETVVETVISHCTDAGLDRPRVLDMGTGSGCIAVSLLVQLSGASAVGTDVSPAALEVAVGNADRHGVSDRFVAVNADRLALPSEVVPEGGFDVLVSNPPYVAGNDVDGLDSTVRDYEPHKALSDGQDGLSFYRSIATDAPRVLAADGVIVVEVGDGQAQVVIDTMVSDALLVHRETHKDRVVGQERVLVFAVR